MNRLETGHRVLFVIESAFPTPGSGGAEAQVQLLARELRARDLLVQVVSPRVSYNDQAEHELVDGVPLWRIKYPYVRLVGGLVLLSKLAWYLIWERHRYDVIHAHIAHNMAAVACIAGKLVGKPVVVKLTGWLEMQRGILSDHITGPTGYLRRWAIRQATYYQATSNEIAGLLEQHGFARDKIVYLPNAVDLSRFKIDGKSFQEGSGVGTRPLTGVFVGRLVPEKSLDVLIKAWGQAFTPDAPVRLVIVGDGPLRESLESQVKQAKLDHQIEFVGRSEEVPRYLAEADFGLLPSTFEGLSNTLLEYLSAGLPVIGSRISGTEDFVVTGETGWLFEAGNETALAGCLRQVSSTSSHRRREMGQASRARVMEQAGIERVVDRLLDLYGLAN